MSDLFKSAMGYFNTGPINTSDNEFVGQIVEVGSVKLRVKRVIAEGWCIFYATHFAFKKCHCMVLLLLLLLSVCSSFGIVCQLMCLMEMALNRIKQRNILLHTHRIRLYKHVHICDHAFFVSFTLNQFFILFPPVFQCPV